MANVADASNWASDSTRVRPDRSRWVPETRFGFWFLGTNVWSRYVVEVALNDLARLMPAGARKPRVLLDAGCGPGVSLPLLDRYFQPERIIGLDIDPKEVRRSSARAAQCRCAAEVRLGDVTRLDLADNSVDMVLCHQLLHHLVRQEQALREFFRVLAPGGALLVAESCREFILTAPVRLLFRHPNEKQQSPEGYQRLVRAAGFDLDAQSVKSSTPFWSQTDWGFTRKLGWRRASDEDTEVVIAAIKPAAPTQ